MSSNGPDGLTKPYTLSEIWIRNPWSSTSEHSPNSVATSVGRGDSAGSVEEQSGSRSAML